MEPKTLRPSDKALDLKGNLYYRESLQAWNTIRFRKELINKFPELKEKRASFSYRIIFYQDYAKLEKAVREMKSEDKPLPILLFLVKEPEADSY